MPFFKYVDRSIFYEEYGTGKPLVFLHGNTASSKMFELRKFPPCRNRAPTVHSPPLGGYIKRKASNLTIQRFSLVRSRELESRAL